MAEEHPITETPSLGGDAKPGSRAPSSDDDVSNSVPNAESGIAVPTPLKKEDRIRAEEATQSAHELSEALHKEEHGEQGHAPPSSTAPSPQHHDNSNSG